ncbi:MAG: helix-turn-helix domain-containing protein [Candidatus Magasanikbacteria bacterium]
MVELITFKKKCLVPSERVCFRLKFLREQKNISLSELENRTKISKLYLEAIEQCRFSDLPQSSLYKKNFIKKFVKALGEDPKCFVDQFVKEELTYIPQNSNTPKLKYNKYYFSNMPSILRISTFVLVIGSLLFFLGFHIKNILTPPNLMVVSPENGYISNNNFVDVHGKTDPEIQITINNQAVKNDSDGNFNQNINLLPGINTFVIKAKNKHGKTTEEIRNVIYKNSGSVSLK